MALILAFDLGTGGNKASVFDSSGRYVASEFVEYPTTYPCVGWHEQAPEDWYQAVVTSTRKLLAHPEIDPREISCLAISGHSLGCVPLDSQGNLLRRTTPIWSDVRAVEEAALFFEKEDP
ncbi:MAG: hypothetical protein IKW74_06715, partial [Thermoguttaceae bacterium]|nr:hypothetical protein [Thermoguttaceae bacterium]